MVPLKLKNCLPQNDLNMVDTELQLDDTSSSDSAAAVTDEHKPTRAELKEVLIDIQINVNNILRDNIKI